MPIVAKGSGSIVLKSYTFAARTANSGEYFLAGFYNYDAAEAVLTNLALTQVHGNANHPYAAHVFLVAKQAGVTNGSNLVITITGTSITDAGVRNASASEVLVADATAAVADQYFETVLKFIGAYTYTLSSDGGAFDFSFNYGACKYEDFGNRQFVLTDIEAVGLANATDAGFNIEIIHHRATGWTYSAAGFQAGPAAYKDMNTIHSTESDLVNGEMFAFKLAALNKAIAGNDSEGLIVRVTTGANNSISYMNLHLGVKL